MYGNRNNVEQEFNLYGSKLFTDTDHRMGKSSSPASVSDLTDNNSSSTSQLNEEMSNVNNLKAQLEQIQTNNTDGTSTYSEPIQE